MVEFSGTDHIAASAKESKKSPGKRAASPAADQIEPDGVSKPSSREHQNGGRGMSPSVGWNSTYLSVAHCSDAPPAAKKAKTEQLAPLFAPKAKAEPAKGATKSDERSDVKDGKSAKPLASIFTKPAKASSSKTEQAPAAASSSRSKADASNGKKADKTDEDGDVYMQNEAEGSTGSATASDAEDEVNEEGEEELDEEAEEEQEGKAALKL